MERIEFEDALVVEPAKVSVLDEMPVGTVVDYEGTEIPAGWELLPEVPILASFTNLKEAVKISTSNRYGVVFIVSAMFVCVVQLQGDIAPNIVDIVGTHEGMTSILTDDGVILNGFYNWDHYIMIGSSVVTNIERVNKL